MKKSYLCLFVSVLSLVSITSFSYQPAEHGIIFGGKFRNNNKKSLNKTDKPMIFSCEKNLNGNNSRVLRINGLSQFLTLSVNYSLPIIVRIFSDEKKYQETFQRVAEKFKDKAIFVSFNSFTNAMLAQIFLYILKSKGINLPNGNEFLPIFLFCEPDFVVLQDHSVGFKKDSLRLLAVRFLKNDLDLENMINKVFSKNRVNAENSQISQNQTKSKSSNWKTIKSWFK